MDIAAKTEMILNPQDLDFRRIETIRDTRWGYINYEQFFDGEWRPWLIGDHLVKEVKWDIRTGQS